MHTSVFSLRKTYRCETKFRLTLLLMLNRQACDNRNPNRPVFFVTEDQEFGALRKFEANGNGWDSLHRAGRTTFLRILNNSTFEFTSNLALARLSAATYDRNAEGIYIYMNMHVDP